MRIAILLAVLLVPVMLYQHEAPGVTKIVFADLFYALRALVTG